MRDKWLSRLIAQVRGLKSAQERTRGNLTPTVVAAFDWFALKVEEHDPDNAQSLKDSALDMIKREYPEAWESIAERTSQDI